MRHGREVSRKDYYAVVGQLDVVGEVIGSFPYTVIHCERNTRREVGRVVDEMDGALIKHRYFLA